MNNPCPVHDIDTYIGCPTCHPPAETKGMRLFHLQRVEDESGISGTGRVADGVVFEDGHAVIRWRTATSSTACYDSVADVEAIHGHNSKTVVVWVDAEGEGEGDARVRALEATLRRHRDAIVVGRHTLTPIQQDALDIIVADLDRTLSTKAP